MDLANFSAFCIMFIFLFLFVFLFTPRFFIEMAFLLCSFFHKQIHKTEILKTGVIFGFIA